MLSNYKMKIFLLIIIVFFSGCSDPSKEDKGKIQYPEMTEFTKSVIDSLGEVNEYREDGFILYCKKGSYADANRDFLIKRTNEAIARIKVVLEIDEIPKAFYLIMLDSRDEMAKIIGRRYKGLSIRRDDLGLFVFNKEIRPYLKHELFHLIAFNVWGETNSRLLNEGGATYADNTCLHYKEPIETINKYLYEKNMWFNIEDLVNDFSVKAGENDLIAYLESAFIFKFLYETYGREKMIRLWQNGFGELENIYGFNILQLGNKIKAQLKNIQYEEVGWKELMEKGCG